MAVVPPAFPSKWDIGKSWIKPVEGSVYGLNLLFGASSPFPYPLPPSYENLLNEVMRLENFSSMLDKSDSSMLDRCGILRNMPSTLNRALRVEELEIYLLNIHAHLVALINIVDMTLEDNQFKIRVAAVLKEFGLLNKEAYERIFPQ